MPSPCCSMTRLEGQWCLSSIRRGIRGAPEDRARGSVMSDARTAKKGLGRGLSALMADIDLGETNVATAPSRDRSLIPIEQITANPDQPRRHFDPEALQELADSLRSRGVLQPLIVRPHPTSEGLSQIVAGERRWRAAQMAQLHELPVIIRELSDTDVIEIAIIENIQRADLNA